MFVFLDTPLQCVIEQWTGCCIGLFSYLCFSLCRNCLPDNLYCVAGDVEDCSVNQSLLTG